MLYPGRIRFSLFAGGVNASSSPLQTGRSSRHFNYHCPLFIFAGYRNTPRESDLADVTMLRPIV